MGTRLTCNAKWKQGSDQFKEQKACFMVQTAVTYFSAEGTKVLGHVPPENFEIEKIWNSILCILSIWIRPKCHPFKGITKIILSLSVIENLYHALTPSLLFSFNIDCPETKTVKVQSHSNKTVNSRRLLNWICWELWWPHSFSVQL